MINVIPEPVDTPVPTGFAGAKKSNRNTPSLIWQMTLEYDLSADEVVVADPKYHDTFVGGLPSTTPKIAGLTVNLAGDVTAGVASLAEVAEDVTAGVASSADLAKDVTSGVTSLADLAAVVTAGVASSADLAKDVTASVASLADLAEVVTAGVTSSADLAGDVTAGVASLADLAEVVTAGVAPSTDPDGDVTAGVTSMEEYKEHVVVLSDVVLPQADPYKLSAELDTIVVGAVGTGAPDFWLGGQKGPK